MLDKKVFSEGMTELTFAYPTWTMQVDNKSAMAMWYKYFSNMEDDQFLQTIENFVKASSYLPTVAGLLEHKAKRQSRPEVEFVEVTTR